MLNSSLLLVVSALALTACTASASSKVQTPVAAVSSAEPTAPAEPTGLPDRHDKETGYPIVYAGMFNKFTSLTVTGTESTVVEFEREGVMSALWTLDCPDCVGPVVVKLADPDLFMWNMEGPVSDSSWIAPVYIADINSLTVEADGEWTIEFTSWSTLTEEAGDITGHGPRAFTVDPSTTSITVTYTETFPGDVLNLAAWKSTTFNSIPASTLVGSGTQTFDLEEPHTVFINAPGDWVATPNH